MKHTTSFVVTGRVQGVYFRKYTQNKAISLALSGWVQNSASGQVVGEVSGERNALEEFKEWLHHGSPLAKVEVVEWKKINPKAFDGFVIK